MLLRFLDQSQDVLARFCGRIRKIPPSSARRRPRVVLHGFPGGAEAFELVARFCYAGGGDLAAAVTASNACALRCAAAYLDMPAPTLVAMAEKALDEMPHWPWHAVVDAVRQCQRLLPLSDATGAFDRAVSALACHVSAALPLTGAGGGGGDATPTSSSPESAAFRFSCDTKSSCLSLRGSSSSRTWWFDDLVSALGPAALPRVATALAARSADHRVVARFLFYYLKCRVAGATSDDKTAMIEAVVGAMAGLDRAAVSCKGLFGMLRISAPLHISAASHDRLVALIGRKLDHATLDNLLVPAPPSGSGTGLYDVGLVLRFVEAFLRSGDHDDGPPAPARMKKVGRLVDLYLAEVGPDPSLGPARFVQLATALPAAARDSHDVLYRAIDVYFQVRSLPTRCRFRQHLLSRGKPWPRIYCGHFSTASESNACAVAMEFRTRRLNVLCTN